MRNAFQVGEQGVHAGALARHPAEARFEGKSGPCDFSSSHFTLDAPNVRS